MSSPKLITVLLAEDHSIVRQGLCALLLADGGFRIIGEARNGREAVAMSQKLQPDIILMDIAMPLLNGLEATRQILLANPAAKVVVLSAHSEDEYITRMNQAGVAGFLEKQTSAEILTHALHEVALGRRYFSPSMIKRMARTTAHLVDRNGLPKGHKLGLTTREAEVLQLVAEGSANKQIATELKISVKTVEKHRNNLMKKLNIHDTAGLTRHAIASGVIECKVELTIIE